MRVVHQVRASERVFAALYRNKHKLVMTRPLRLQLPPHPEPSPREGFQWAGNGMKDKASLGVLDSTADPDEESRELQQKQWEQRRQEHDQEQEKEHQQQQQQREEERQLQSEQQQQQQRKQDEQEQRRQQQLTESTLAKSSLSTTASGASSPKRPHAVRRMASKVAAVVRQGSKIIMRNSPRSSPRSPRAAALGTSVADAIGGGGRPGDDNAETKKGGDGSHAPAEGKAVEVCPADRAGTTSPGTLSNGLTITTTMDRADSYPATFFPDQKPQKQEQQQGPQGHQARPEGYGDNPVVLRVAHAGAVNGGDLLLSPTACQQTLKDGSEIEVCVDEIPDELLSAARVSIFPLSLFKINMIFGVRPHPLARGDRNLEKRGIATKKAWVGQNMTHSADGVPRRPTCFKHVY